MNDHPTKRQIYDHHWDRPTFDAIVEQAHLVPTKLHLQLTRRCSHRCVTCNHHLAGSDEVELSPKVVMDLLIQGRAFGMDNLSLTGGEPMMRSDILEIISAASALDYRTITVASNGDHLADPDIARAVIEAGATHLPLSLHGLETHDAIVGASGSRARVMRAVDNLMKLTAGDGDRISVGMVAQRDTLDQLDAMAAYTRQVGCGLRINVLDQNLFFFSSDTRTAELFPEDETAIDLFIERCFELSAEGLLKLWPRNIVFMERYLKRQPITSPCPVGLEAIFVAHDGRILPGCWATDAETSVSTHDLTSAWASASFRAALHRVFSRRCPGCGCTYRTMSAWYSPYVVEGWLRTGRI